MYFNDNICVITGSGSGIGRALALGLGSRGATVIASDINETNVKETAALVNEAGPGKAIAEAIKNLFLDKERQLSLSKLGRQRMENKFNWMKAAKGYEEIYAKAIEEFHNKNANY